MLGQWARARRPPGTGILRRALFALFASALALLPAAAGAACTGNTIVGCPSAISPGSSDLLLGWQPGQTPHTRIFSLPQVLGAGLPASVSTLSASGAVTLNGGGIFSGTISGDHTYSGDLTLSGANTGLTVSNSASIGNTLTTKFLTGTRTTAYNTGQAFGPGVALTYYSTATSGPIGSGAGTAAAFVWNTTGNSVDAGAFSSGYYNAWFQINESGTKGNQGDVNIRLTQTGATVDTNPFFWNPLTVKCDLEFAAGSSQSNCIASSSITFMGAGATNWGLVEGGEFGINRTLGSAVTRSTILNLTYNSTAPVASSLDVGLAFSSSPGNTTGMSNLLSIGQGNTQWPMSTSGYFWLVTQQTNQNPGNTALAPNEAAGAFNFSNVHFNGGHVLWSAGLDLNADQSATIGALHIADGGSGPVLSASYYEATSCSVSATGSGGYVNGEEVYPTGQAGVITITASGGVVTGCSWTKAAFSATNPATLATTGGSGNEDFVASVGWTLHSTLGIGNDATTATLNIGRSAGSLGFYGAAAIAKATPVGACAGNTGCQALRDALGNLGLINTGSITN